MIILAGVCTEAERSYLMLSLSLISMVIFNSSWLVNACHSSSQVRLHNMDEILIRTLLCLQKNENQAISLMNQHCQIPYVDR
ncbi:hypothetical protein B0T20DRAFT_195806 [Sordaria brevicollis]|uniref:Uncharacterized protein n=1 Tax=Sordaria brevicollis TaxID=83679 RepID=A0AAE0PG38_SORBR|nr:hypothetical protein B0T20DRAFT_195806 [Sordaria brevicollis]